MRGFAEVTHEVVMPFTGTPLIVTLAMRSYREIVPSVASPPPAVPETVEAPDENAIVDVINGSVVNGAASPFAQPRAFGNNRPRSGAGYSGLVSGVFANSAWNARPFSFGSIVPPPYTGDAQFGFTLGGPLKIPRIVRSGPQMLITLQHAITHTATSGAAGGPAPGERRGGFSALAGAGPQTVVPPPPSPTPHSPAGLL